MHHHLGPKHKDTHDDFDLMKMKTTSVAKSRPACFNLSDLSMKLMRIVLGAGH